MKIVLDTNVLISGFLSPGGHPAKILALIIDGEIEVCLDTRIAEEYMEVLSRPEWPFSRKEALDVLGFILENSLLVHAEPLSINIPDPDDLMFIEAAVSAKADAIVAGNKRHFPKGATGKITILSPAEFLKLIGKIIE
jgi:putative PIN family toxin of toxin-antitoxin system